MKKTESLPIESSIGRLAIDSEPETARQPIDFSLMGNPFAEISHNGDFHFVKELVRNTAVEKILRIEGVTAWDIRVFPGYGINPFDILSRFKASDDQAKTTVTSYSQKLSDLFGRVNGNRLNSLCNHLVVKDYKHHCLVCDKPMKNGDTTKMIEHIISKAHVEKMRRSGLVYSFEAVVFWMYALRIAQKDAAWWFPGQKKVNRDIMVQKAIADTKNAKTARLEKLGGDMGETMLETLKEQHKKKEEAAAKIGEVVRREMLKKNPAVEPVIPRIETIFDILSANISLIKSPFNEIAHPGGETVVKKMLLLTDAKTILKFEQNRLFPIDGIDPLDILRPVPVRKGELEDAVGLYTAKLRMLFFTQPKDLFQSLVSHLLDKNVTYCCELCSCPISSRSASNVIYHIVQRTHKTKMLQGNLAYPMKALAFWMHALNITHTKKEPDLIIE